LSSARKLQFIVDISKFLREDVLGARSVDFISKASKMSNCYPILLYFLIKSLYKRKICNKIKFRKGGFGTFCLDATGHMSYWLLLLLLLQYMSIKCKLLKLDYVHSFILLLQQISKSIRYYKWWTHITIMLTS